MNSKKEAILRLLVIDDDEQHLKFVASVLAQDDVQIWTARDPVLGLELVRRHRPHLVFVDLMMPNISGMEVLEQIVAFDPATEVVLLTGDYSTDRAVEAIQKGASDYLTKPVSVERLMETAESLLASLRARRRCSQLENELVENCRFAGMVGRSPLMLEMFHKIRRVAPHYRTVLVNGQTGTGKELVARALHQLSPVARGPLVTCNCSALVETLAESELFGHVKGAFTGAVQDRLGIFETANGGTVFLDEAGELSPSIQAKLLRVLQNGEVQRVGSAHAKPVDVRVIAATHRDLPAMVSEQQFREDLFYRLSMVQIKVPSLAERKEDLPLLERYFLERFALQFGKPVRELTSRAEAILARYQWPGNVRELENVLGGACMLSEADDIDTGDLPEYLRARQAAAETVGEFDSLDQIERAYTLRVLQSVGGNKVRAAEVLKISRAKLYRIIADSELSEGTESSADAN